MRYICGVEPHELLRAVRRRSSLTQAELARLSGTSQPVISAYERGRRDPTYGTLSRIIRAAGERMVLDAAPVRAHHLAPPADRHEHARRLVDVLSLADAIPVKRRSARLHAPRLVSR